MTVGELVLAAMTVIDITPFYAGKVTSYPNTIDISLEECLSRAQRSAEAGWHLYSRNQFRLDDWVSYNGFLADILRRRGQSIDFVKADDADLAMISPIILFESYSG